MDETVVGPPPGHRTAWLIALPCVLYAASIAAVLVDRVDSVALISVVFMAMYLVGTGLAARAALTRRLTHEARRPWRSSPRTWCSRCRWAS